MHARPISAPIATVASDLAKDVFQLTFANAERQRAAHQRLLRYAIVHALDNVPPRYIEVVHEN